MRYLEASVGVNSLDQTCYVGLTEGPSAPVWQDTVTGLTPEQACAVKRLVEVAQESIYREALLKASRLIDSLRDELKTNSK